MRKKIKMKMKELKVALIKKDGEELKPNENESERDEQERKWFID